MHLEFGKDKWKKSLKNYAGFCGSLYVSIIYETFMSVICVTVEYKMGVWCVWPRFHLDRILMVFLEEWLEAMAMELWL